MSDGWDPVQYEQFAVERRRPFDDLVALLDVPGGRRVVDLGCGTGELTVDLHRATGAASTLGLDSSPAMLERAQQLATDGVRFGQADVATWEPPAPLDLVFSNATLQWLPRHEALLARLTAFVAPGGWLAVQVPANSDHPSHTVAVELAGAPPFADALRDVAADPVAGNVLPPERYAELLHDLGYHDVHVRLQVYGPVLPGTASVVEWTKGTTLTRFRAVLDDEAYGRFVATYRERLVGVLGDRSPYYYAFKRILFAARRPA